MNLHRPLSVSLLTAGVACGGADSSSRSDGTTSAATGSVTTDPTSTGTSTTAADSTTALASTTAADSTTAVASTSSSGAPTTGESTVAATTDAVAPPPLAEYCACMLDVCHDQYHAMWGEDHVQAEMMCLADAGAWPTVGMPATSGNSIECRYDACTKKDCEGANGGGACV